MGFKAFFFTSGEKYSHPAWSGVVEGIAAHSWRAEQNESPFQSKLFYYSMKTGIKQLNPKLLLSTNPQNMLCSEISRV